MQFKEMEKTDYLKSQLYRQKIKSLTELYQRTFGEQFIFSMLNNLLRCDSCKNFTLQPNGVMTILIKYTRRKSKVICFLR